jgi:glucose/arabinose dehydrogenase
MQRAGAGEEKVAGVKLVLAAEVCEHARTVRADLADLEKRVSMRLVVGQVSAVRPVKDFDATGSEWDYGGADVEASYPVHKIARFVIECDMIRFSRRMLATIVLGLTASTLSNTLAKPGDRYYVDPAHLPGPFATRSVLRIPRIVSRAAGAKLSVPPGFHVLVLAGGFHNPRWMTVLPNGDIVVIESRVEVGPNLFPKRIWILQSRPGKPVRKFLFAVDRDLPLGVDYRNGYLYVANTDQVVRWRFTPGQTKAGGDPEVVISGIPGHGYNQHWSRNILFSPTGDRLFLTVGSEFNLAEEKPPRACVTVYPMNADGLPSGAPTVYASGLRNPVGLAFNPVTGVLWTTCNERDYTGDDLVPDFLTGLKPGGFYGWPNYYIGRHRDPRMPSRPDLRRRSIVPDVLFQSHSAPLGLVFYRGHEFPKEYRGDAFVAMHGSTNRHERTGYKVVRIHFDAHGRPVHGYEDFLTGWLPNPNAPEVWGRPAGLAVDATGALLIADDGGGKIWRVTYGR